MDQTPLPFVLDDGTQRVLKKFNLAVLNLVSIRGRVQFSSPFFTDGIPGVSFEVKVNVLKLQKKVVGIRE